MKITVEVTITAYCADGTQIQVTNGARKQVGDNLRFAGDEASEVADAAARASLAGFRAAAENRRDAGAAQERPTAEEAAEVLPGFAGRRDYVMNALDARGVPSAADANTARAMLLDNGMDTDATDAELEAFQALRRQILNAPTKDEFEDDRVLSLVRLLDGFGARNSMGPAQLGDVLLERMGDSVTMPSYRILKRASDIRCARKED